MAEESLIFGPPGCGKTHTMIEIVRQELANGTPPDRIGFVSFSRKSIEEARSRVSSTLQLTEKGCSVVQDTTLDRLQLAGHGKARDDTASRSPHVE